MIVIRIFEIKKKNSVSLFIGMLLVTLFTLIACNSIEDKNHNFVTNYGVSFSDQMGDKSFTNFPSRIASFSPEITEIIYALGSGGQIVAINDSSDYPLETAFLPKRGFMNINVESIIKYDPNLIILTAGFEEVAHKLIGLGYQVIFFDAPKNITQLYDNIITMGKILDNHDGSEALVADLQSQMNKTLLEVSKVKVQDKKTLFLEIDPMLYTASDNSFIGSLLKLANVTNIAASVAGSFPQVSLEFIIDSNPDIILLADTDFGTSVENVLQRDTWKNITAVKNKNIYAIEADWISRAGPRFILGLQQIISLVYEIEFAD
jgi:iron complex transport system substrate-binding protein